MTIEETHKEALRLFLAHDLRGAENLYRQILAQQPANAEALFNLGNIYIASARYDGAIDAYRSAIAHRPDYADAYGNLGNALAMRGDFAEAKQVCLTSIKLRPSVVAFNNLGNVMRELGDIDGSIEKYRNALAINPEHPQSHWNLAISLLLKGDLKEGFEEYEWRLRMKEYVQSPEKFFHPGWNLDAIQEKRILIYAEQGIGDTIQFVRYLPMIIARGGIPILECHPDLVRMMSGMPGVVVSAKGKPRPAVDLHCPILSLPGVFGTEIGNIPATVPYLYADDQIAAKWSARIGKNAKRKIGLVWAGHPNHIRDRFRSIPLSQFAPLAKIAGAQFFSLQKGEGAAQAKMPPVGMELIDWTNDLVDFSETAGLIANLDLVITVDTAVAHLAGAMGKPVWVILGRIPDWRWMMDRGDSPWYPSMRLFRQSVAGNWRGVIEEVSGVLRGSSAA